MEEMIQEEPMPVVPKGRRRLLKNAFVTGLGAMLATEVACGPLRGVKSTPAEERAGRADGQRIAHRGRGDL